ncbi:hypothetical protein [Gimesia aquarii]|uniref:DUF2231 domain-containing protein n=1 Tax=Gimesia aquarii TaxID=2527964 RepID=A0A517WYJ7_9PLAN|nr:hypothetical protein [Gimesia aquarii]QDU10327.1 hypothetical protein V202x_37260 [Gimesia aquarii]
MNAAQVHLLTVHIPVIGCWGLSILFLLAQYLRDDRLFKISCWLFLTLLLAATIAYFSGPPAYDLLKDNYSITTETVEFHAILARSGLLAMVVLSMVVGNALVQGFQGEKIPGWQRWVILISILLLSIFWGVVAHWGGLIRHPEIQYSVSKPIEKSKQQQATE